VWLAAPGWLVYNGYEYPDLDNYEEIRDLEGSLISKNCIALNESIHTVQIVLPGPDYSESYSRLTDVLQKTTLDGQILFYDFDPQFIYEGSGIKSPRYKVYMDFKSLPQHQGQAFLSFLNMVRGNYIFFYHFDKQKIMLYITQDTIQVKNEGRREFMTVSFEANCWDLE
jgi:hypothetical protein